MDNKTIFDPKKFGDWRTYASFSQEGDGGALGGLLGTALSALGVGKAPEDTAEQGVQPLGQGLGIPAIPSQKTSGLGMQPPASAFPTNFNVNAPAVPPSIQYSLRNPAAPISTAPMVDMNNDGIDDFWGIKKGL